MDNNIIISSTQLLDFTSEIRLLRRGFITNFFLNDFKHTLWIDKKEFSYYHINDTYFLIRNHNSISHLFFISTSLEELSESLKIYINLFIKEHSEGKTNNLVIDIVGKNSINDLRDTLFECGFYQYQSLHRMNRCGLFSLETEIIDDVLYAEEEDLPTIFTYLNQFFDPLSEQLPMIEEIIMWQKENNIIVYKINNNIAGFLIFEIQGVTLYLRYWFVHPDHRDQKVGSKLFARFRQIGNKTKRQLFWVINDNENAIKRYKHYGFESENMYDYVLLYKNYK